MTNFDLTEEDPRFWLNDFIWDSTDIHFSEIYPIRVFILVLDNKVYKALVSKAPPKNDVCDAKRSGHMLQCRLPKNHDGLHIAVTYELLCLFPNLHITKLSITPYIGRETLPI